MILEDKMESLIGEILPGVCMVLLLSSVSNCRPDCKDLRLYNKGHMHGQGRVEIFCDGQWGTISSNDTNLDVVVCRYQGFDQNWRPNRTTEFGEGSGTVWDVRCNGEELNIQDCCINPTDPVEYYFYGSENLTFFDHEKDIGVKCRGQYIGDMSQNERFHKDDIKSTQSDHSVETDIISSTGGQPKDHGNSPEIIAVDVVGFALILAAIALCGFLLSRRLAVTSYASKEKDHSQTLLSPSSHVTVHAETTSHDQPDESGLVHTEETDSHGPALTEVNLVYEPAIEMAETSLVGKRQDSRELTDSSDPVLTEVNPCYGAAVEMTGTSVAAQLDGQETIDLEDVPALTDENFYYEKC